MTFDELNENQIIELKQNILTGRNDDNGEGTSYEELANADELISDEFAKAWAEGMDFSPDDFSCSASEPNVVMRNVPRWAVCYLVNADSSGLADEDRRMADEWVRKLKSQGLKPVCPVEGSENEFCSAPAFGPACDTVDFAAARIDEETT